MTYVIVLVALFCLFMSGGRAAPRRSLDWDEPDKRQIRREAAQRRQADYEQQYRRAHDVMTRRRYL
jgi:hypothetical protein